jgi:hypothetical protein
MRTIVRRPRQEGTCLRNLAPIEQIPSIDPHQVGRLAAASRGPRLEALSYPDNVGVVAFLETAKRTVCPGAMVDTKDQLGIRKIGQGKARSKPR